MRWNIRQLLMATVVVVLLLVAYRLLWTGSIYSQSRFVIAGYMAQLTVATVGAWNAPAKWKAGLLAYALYGWIYGAFFLKYQSNWEDVLRISAAGIVFSIACGLTVAMLLPSRSN